MCDSALFVIDGGRGLVSHAVPGSLVSLTFDSMNLSHALLVATLASSLAACSKRPEDAPKPKTAATVAGPQTVVVRADPKDRHDDATEAAHEAAIAWRRGDVDVAFAEAKAANKPVFLYWGASWCPPCNQVKATLFNKREFIERTQFFVPVYVDGDVPAAQKIGTRFSVSGYPTMVLFKPDGTEVTRLPGEADPARYMQMLALGMSATRPVRETLKSAMADGKGLTRDDWRMLAWYSWDTDDQQLVATSRVPAMLKKLAAHCPADYGDVRTRLMLKAAAAAGDMKGQSKVALGAIEAVLASPTSARENFDLLTNAMPELVRAATAPASTGRAKLIVAADHALARLAADATLSNTDRLGATIARVQLASLDGKPATVDNQRNMQAAPVSISDSLNAEVRHEAARADRESNDPYERQTVINAAAYLLTSAGLIDESDTLLKAELSRSHSPYYFMLDLASNAKKRGDKTGAIEWYAKAYDAAEGPATRLQWGATYVTALIELSPGDATRIERAATKVIGEVEPAPSSFDGRNRKSLSRMATKIATWNAKGVHAAEATRIAQQSRALCERVPADAPERARCGALLKVATTAGKTA